MQASCACVETLKSWFNIECIVPNGLDLLLASSLDNCDSAVFQLLYLLYYEINTSSLSLWRGDSAFIGVFYAVE